MALEVSIRKRFPRFTLEAELRAEKGVTALFGASGSGKSLTLRCIAGVERPDEGYIALDGVTFFDSSKHIDLPPQKRHVGLMFQSCALFPRMSVRENIAAGLPGGLDRGTREARVAQYMSRFGLEGLGERLARELSGGERQRAALARMMIGEPSLVMLDEPLSALDSHLRWQTELELMKTLREFSGTALLVTHSRDEVYRMCSMAAVIAGGRTEPAREVRALFDAPGTCAAALLSGCENIASAQHSGQGCFESEWGLKLSLGTDVPEGVAAIGVRAREVRKAGRAGDICLPCRVLGATEDIDSTIVMLRPEGAKIGAPPLMMRLRPGEGGQVGGDARLDVFIAPDAIMLLKDSLEGNGPCTVRS